MTTNESPIFQADTDPSCSTGVDVRSIRFMALNGPSPMRCPEIELVVDGAKVGLYYQSIERRDADFIKLNALWVYWSRRSMGLALV